MLILWKLVMNTHWRSIGTTRVMAGMKTRVSPSWEIGQSIQLNHHGMVKYYTPQVNPTAGYYFRLFPYQESYSKVYTWSKPWPNELASWCKFPLATHLYQLAPGWAQFRMQVDASFSPFGHPRKVDTSWSKVNCICVEFMTFCNLCVNLRVNLWIHLTTQRKSIHKSWFAILLWLASTYESIWPRLYNCIHRLSLQLSGVLVHPWSSPPPPTLLMAEDWAFCIPCCSTDWLVTFGWPAYTSCSPVDT